MTRPGTDIRATAKTRAVAVATRILCRDQAARNGMEIPPLPHGRVSDVTRRADVRHVERGHNVPPRSETSKERTNASVRAQRQSLPE